MGKIIVTGGAGYIGSHTVVELAKAGFTPVIVDDLRNSHPSALKGIAELLGHQPTFHSVDCLDQDRLHEVFQREGEVQGVIHFAAYKAVGESVAEPLKYYENNIASLVNVLQVMQMCGVNDLVFSSSCTVYGQPEVMPVNEAAPDHTANSPYGFTKVVGERMIRDVVRSNPALRTVLLRYFNPIGAHPDGHIGELPIGAPGNLVPFLTQTAVGLRHQLTIHGSDYPTPDGTCVRDYLHVQDVARAHVMALSWIHGQQAPVVEAFNLGAGIGSSVKAVVDLFEEISGLTVPKVYGPRRHGDVAAIWADPAKSREVLGWQCQHDLRSALTHAWRWQLALRETVNG